MFKRVRWMSVGAAVGFGGSVWAQRRVRRTVQRYLPEQVRATAGKRARDLRTDVREALDEGRLAMHQREAELRAQVEGHPAPAELAPPASKGRGEQVIDVDERLGAGRLPAVTPASGRARGTRHRRRR